MGPFRWLGLVGSLGTLAGCSSSAPASDSSSPLTTGSVDERRAAAELQFEKDLSDFEAVYNCLEQKQGPNAHQDCRSLIRTSAMTTPGLRPQGLFTLHSLCPVLRLFKGGLISDLSRPYYFSGASLTYGGGTVVQGGTDIVWDLWNLQAAVFLYGGGGIATLVGADSSAYFGYGFGNKSGVVDAWSGVFNAGSLSGNVPVLGLSAGVTGFYSLPDHSIWGGAVSGGVKTIGFTPPLSGSITQGIWSEWDDGTKLLAQTIPNASSFTPQTVAWGGAARLYLQFASAMDAAIGLAYSINPANFATAIPEVFAVDLLRQTGFTIEQECPDPDASAAPVAPPLAACPEPAPSCVCTYPSDYAGNALCGWGAQQPAMTVHFPQGSANYWGDQITCSPTSGQFCYATNRWSLNGCDGDPSKVCCYSDATRGWTVECSFKDGSNATSLLDTASACCH